MPDHQLGQLSSIDQHDAFAQILAVSWALGKEDVVTKALGRFVDHQKVVLHLSYAIARRSAWSTNTIKPQLVLIDYAINTIVAASTKGAPSPKADPP